MKHLLTTTAITLLTALPMQAASHEGTDAGAHVRAGERDLSLAGLMGATVYMPDRYTMDTDDITAVPYVWQAVGTVEQVFVDDSGEVGMLVVAPEADSGAGADRIAIEAADLDLMTIRGDEGRMVAVYTGGMDGFAGAAAFDQAAASDMGLMAAEGGPDMADAGGDVVDDIETTAEDIGDATAEAADAVGTAVGEAADATGEALADLSDNPIMDGAVVTAEDLDGAPVYGAAGNEIGEISEIVVSDDGDIDTVVVDVGGFLGIGEKPVALPFGELDITRGDGIIADLRVEVDHTEDELKAMPEWAG